MKAVFTFFTLMFFSVMAFAQSAVAVLSPTPSPVPSPIPGVDLTPVTTDEFLQTLIASVGGLKGATAITIAGIVVKLLIMFLRTDFVNSYFQKAGGLWKLTMVTGLSFIAGIVSLMSSGVPLGMALIHSTVLSALMVFINQVWKQFKEWKAEKDQASATKVDLKP